MLRKVLRLPRLEYTSIMNQGDFLIEVPSDRTDIPRVSWLAWEHFLMQYGSIASTLAASGGRDRTTLRRTSAY